MYGGMRRIRNRNSKTYLIYVKFLDQNKIIMEVSQVWMSNGNKALIDTNKVVDYYKDQGYTNIVICGIYQVDSKSYHAKDK